MTNTEDPVDQLQALVLMRALNSLAEGQGDRNRGRRRTGGARLRLLRRRTR